MNCVWGPPPTAMFHHMYSFTGYLAGGHIVQDSCCCFHCVCSKQKAEFWRHAKVNHNWSMHWCMYHTGSSFTHTPLHYFAKVNSKFKHTHFLVLAYNIWILSMLHPFRSISLSVSSSQASPFVDLPWWSFCTPTFIVMLQNCDIINFFAFWVFVSNKGWNFGHIV